MDLGHLLTLSVLTRLEVSSMVSPDSSCLLVLIFFLISAVVYYGAFCLHIVNNLYCIPVFCPKQVLYLIPLQSLCLFYNMSKVYPAVFLTYFMSAAVIFLASLALIVRYFATL